MSKKPQHSLTIRTIFDLSKDEIERIKLMAKVYAVSGFNSGKSKLGEGDFFLIMMKGLELGINPMAAVDTINIIHGKPTLDAKGMLALVKSSGLLENIHIDSTPEYCNVTIKRFGNDEQVVSFTIEDARTFKTSEWVNKQKTTISLADKHNWKSQPEIMLKWRAITKAIREVFPDILSGLYTHEEIAPDLTATSQDGSMQYLSEGEQDDIPQLPEGDDSDIEENVIIHDSPDLEQWQKVYDNIDKFIGSALGMSLVELFNTLRQWNKELPDPMELLQELNYKHFTFAILAMLAEYRQNIRFNIIYWDTENKRHYIEFIEHKILMYSRDPLREANAPDEIIDKLEKNSVNLITDFAYQLNDLPLMKITQIFDKTTEEHKYFQVATISKMNADEQNYRQIFNDGNEDNVSEFPM